jgi:hypothetical protein
MAKKRRIRPMTSVHDTEFKVEGKRKMRKQQKGTRRPPPFIDQNIHMKDRSIARGRPAAQS